METQNLPPTATQAPQTQGAPPRQGTPLPPGVDIEIRHPKLDFSKSPKYWFDRNPWMTQMMYALSMLFPEGERYFVESVVHYRKQISDPVLKKQISSFGGQEGVHSAEHHRYNVMGAGDYAAKAEKLAYILLRKVGAPISTPLNCLAVTTALEHFTAILANEILENPVYMKASDPVHARLWLWHAAEETEHKAVAFDVYKAVGGDYLRRVLTMVGVTAGIILATSFLTARLLWRDRQIFNLQAAGGLVKWLFLSPGLVFRVFPAWLSYFRPDFHPWQHDNSALLQEWKQGYAAV